MSTFIDHFSDHSAGYAAARPHYPDALYAFLAAVAPSRVCAWDCGCGNGQAALGLARHFTQVCATDPSAPQIENAFPCGNVSYSVQAAEQTTFPDGYFDAVCAATALHWFNFDAFFPEVKRVLKPHGIFAAWGYDWLRISPAFDAVLKATILDVIQGDWAVQNQWLWDGYRNVPFPFERISTPSFSIQLVWDFWQTLAYLHTWSATRRCIERIGPAFLEAAAQKLLTHWGDPSAVREIQMPLHVLVGRV
jgi:SAM-dependent methyltransferase